MLVPTLRLQNLVFSPDSHQLVYRLRIRLVDLVSDTKPAVTVISKRIESKPFAVNYCVKVAARYLIHQLSAKKENFLWRPLVFKVAYPQLPVLVGAESIEFLVCQHY